MTYASRFTLILLLVALAFLFGFWISFLLFNASVTGAVVQESVSHYSWTTAVCNEQHQCIDMLVQCAGAQVVSLTPLTPLIQFSEHWEDPRTERVPLCA